MTRPLDPAIKPAASDMEICDQCNGAGGDNQHSICGKCGGAGGYRKPAAVEGRQPPITTCGQLPPNGEPPSYAPLASVALDTVIGNSKFHGGVRESLTLRQWLELDNRRPDYRARQMALQYICQLEASIREADVGRLRGLLAKARPYVETLARLGNVGPVAPGLVEYAKGRKAMLDEIDAALSDTLGV